MNARKQNVKQNSFKTQKKLNKYQNGNINYFLLIIPLNIDEYNQWHIIPF